MNDFWSAAQRALSVKMKRARTPPAETRAFSSVAVVGMARSVARLPLRIVATQGAQSRNASHDGAS